MLNIAEFTTAVHKNAVDHGWWEDEREYDEVISLIHSEWSEALESYRNNEPMVWYQEKDGHQKPEGIAVELIDGCIRILDLAGKMNYPMGDISVKRSVLEAPAAVDKMNVTKLIAICHLSTSSAFHHFIQNNKPDAVKAMAELVGCVFVVFRWMRTNGLDYEAIIKEKHEYNITRPYRHGGKKA